MIAIPSEQLEFDTNPSNFLTPDVVSKREVDFEGSSWRAEKIGFEVRGKRDTPT
jgi:hypothetical protein